VGISRDVSLHGLDGTGVIELGADDLVGCSQDLTKATTLNEEHCVELVGLEGVNLFALRVKVLHRLDQGTVSLFA